MLFFIGFDAVYALDPLEEEKIRAEIAKLEKETEQIELAIEDAKKPSDSKEPTEWEQSLISEAITIVGSVIVISATAGYAWYKARMIVPLSDQEKLFREFVKKDLSSHYKVKWDIIRDDVLGILSSENKSEEGEPQKSKNFVSTDNNASLLNEPNEALEKYWKIISMRKFPKELYDDIETQHLKNMKSYIKLYNISYLKQRKDETEEKYKKRIKKLADSLTQTVHSEYFLLVAKTLPKLVTIAVTISKPGKSDDTSKWLENSLQKMKWLMILNGISEYEETKILNCIRDSNSIKIRFFKIQKSS